MIHSLVQSGPEFLSQSWARLLRSGAQWKTIIMPKPEVVAGSVEIFQPVNKPGEVSEDAAILLNVPRIVSLKFAQRLCLRYS